MMLPDIFVEGDTEKNVVIYLLEHILGVEVDKERRRALRERPSGKGEISKAIRSELGVLGIKPVRCLVMRDLDEHEGETLESIRQSVEGTVRRLFMEREYEQSEVFLVPHPDFSNVFTYAYGDPDMRLALHIANYPPVSGLAQQFVKSTTDDYVLQLALQPRTASGLLQDLGLTDAESEHIVHKVRKEIPELLQQNGVHVQEAKDYVRIYLSTVCLGMSPTVFAGKLLVHANQEEIERVFASLIAAIRFVCEEDER